MGNVATISSLGISDSIQIIHRNNAIIQSSLRDQCHTTHGLLDTYSESRKNLEWIGHELSQRKDDPKKLDKSRLMAVGHMYAQKCQQKQYHDLILKPKELIKGDLVLVYTLKLHIDKFKKIGFGPCVIEEISSSGAVKLLTLNGEIVSS